MTTVEQDFQMEQFLAWHEKRGGDWEENFACWADSKHLDHADRLAIKTKAHWTLLSESAAAIELGDYLRFEGDRTA